MFKIKCLPGDTLPELTIELIGSFSIDGDLQYHADLSQLKYYIPPPDSNNVCYDLDYNATSTRSKPDVYIKLDDILRWVSDNFNQLERPLSANKGHWLDIDFICRRGALKTIFCSPYIRFNGWIICASKYRGTIYLCEFYADEKKHKHAGGMKNKVYSHRFKFEQYMMADHPSHKPDLSVPINEYKEFRCMFKTKFGNHSLLYAAEIDGISSKQPIKDTLIGKEYKFIELKTIPIYDGNKNLYRKLAPERVLAWWSPNYLSGIETTVCGLKIGKTVRMIEEYSTHTLLQFSKVYCDVNRCRMFCKIFLDYVKRIVVKDHNECMYKFHWDPSAKDIVHYTEELPNNEMYFFLKSWFVDKAENHGK